jgi:hypothetical protein
MEHVTLRNVQMGTLFSMRSSPIVTSCNKEVLLEVVFLVGSVARIYYEDQGDKPVRESFESHGTWNQESPC